MVIGAGTVVVVLITELVVVDEGEAVVGTGPTVAVDPGPADGDPQPTRAMRAGIRR
ncbi:MAG: hypothetical protein WD269_12125 [Acidimicrobiia bacterium]